MTSRYTIFPLGDSALTVDFGNVIDKEVNQRVLALFRKLKSLSLSYLLDLVPAYGSLSVHYDPVSILKHTEDEKTAFETVSEMVRELLEQEHAPLEEEPRHIRVPVCYTGRWAPDLPTIAKEKEIGRAHV